MEPISALSLAANIFQVIGFTVEVIRVANQIHERGSLQQFDDLESASQSCQHGAERLKSKWPGDADPVLTQMCDKIVSTAEDLQKVLTYVRGKDGDSSNPLKGFGPAALATFRTLWKKKLVVNLEQNLKLVRENLQFYVIVLVKTRLDEQSHASTQRDNILKGLDKSTRAGLRSAAGSLQKLTSTTDDIVESQEESGKLAQARHEELLGLIKGVTLTQLTHDPRTSTKVPVMLQYVSDTRRSLANIAVISSLWYPTMQDREDGITEAHKKTFTWAFHSPQNTKGDVAWDDLGQFLRSGAGVYWITGKPGSGKSTLMKWLNRNDQTTNALRTWTGPRRLNTARFYFYYNGSKMQRSEIGVFRSLLHQLLEPRPNLVRRCFGDRYMAMCFAPEEPKTFIPTVWELKRCLETLVRVQKNDSFFLSVDGLDEYEADDTEMAALARCFEDLSTLPNVKGLLSSRPLEPFQQAFKGCPRLRLHDLTRPDITAFVEAKIQEHPGLGRLMKKDIQATRSFIDEIVEASSGVFLWVHLVVRSLLEGLQNYDELDDLRQRLAELPTDLADLYDHMWNRIPRRYRAQASKLLQIVEAATANGSRLSVMGLCFAYEKNENLVHDTAVVALDDEETALLHEMARVHISSRCMGLVEIRKMGFAPSPLANGGLFNTDLYDNSVEYTRYKHPHVVFIHRTISEFISQTHIRQRLIEATPGFVAAVALFRSAVHRIKTYIYNEIPPHGLPKSLESLVYYALIAGARAEAVTGESQTSLMFTLDKVMQTHLRRFVPNANTHWSDYLVEIGEVGSADPSSRIRGSTLLSLSVRMGLSYFVEYLIRSGDASTKLKQLPRPLLDFALRPYCRNPKLSAFSLKRRPEMIHLLLTEVGADPNEKLKKGTIWEYFLTDLEEDARRDSQYFYTTPNILTSLLESGANPFTRFQRKKLDKDHTHYYIDHDLALCDPVVLFGEMSRFPAGFLVQSPNWAVFSSEMKQVVKLAMDKKKPPKLTSGPRTETVPTLGLGSRAETPPDPQVDKPDVSFQYQHATYSAPRRRRRSVWSIVCCIPLYRRR